MLQPDILRYEIEQTKEKQKAVRDMLRRHKARAARERAVCAGYVGPPHCSESIGAIMGEADWDAEIFFISLEEAHLP